MVKLRFLHIPKTAGTTVLSVLNLQYPHSRKFIFRGDIEADIDRWHQLGDFYRERIGVVAGHVPLTTGIVEIDQAPTFTLLRHPVERAASFCRHVLDPKKSHYLRHQGYDTIDKIIGHADREVSNMQTRMLVLNAKDYQRQLTLNPQTLSDYVSSAIEKLEGMCCYGIQESFDSSMILISRCFGWKLPPIYRVRNESSRAAFDGFSKLHIAKLEDLNAADIALYDAAVKILERRVSEASDFDHNLSRFRLTNYRSQGILRRLESSARLLSQILSSVRSS